MNKLQEKQNARAKIMEFEEAFAKSPNSTSDIDKICPVTHTFTDGMYIREIFMPKGTLLTSKIHKTKHPYFVMTGKAEVVTDEGVVVIEAPYHGITQPNTKRVLKIIEDMVWITCHATEETDLKKIEEQVIAKSFNEIENNSSEQIESEV